MKKKISKDIMIWRFKAESKFLNVQKIFKKNQKELLGSTIKLSNTTISKSRNKFLKQTLV